MLNVIGVPTVGVKVMAVGTTLKLTSPSVKGASLEFRTKLTLAVPPPPPPLPCGKPLQELKEIKATTIRKGKAL
jgi:hypothetical protein